MTFIVIKDDCAAHGCGYDAADGFILCWAHWGELPKKSRDAAWDVRLRLRQASDPDERARLQKQIDDFRRDLPAMLKTGASSRLSNTQVMP
jgi:hypothetical protein